MAFGDHGIAGDLFKVSGIIGGYGTREDLFKMCGMIWAYGIAEDLLWHGRGSFQNESQCESVLHPND